MIYRYMVYCQNMIDVKYNTYIICIYCNDKHYYIWMQFDLFMVGCNIYIMNHGSKMWYKYYKYMYNFTIHSI